MQMLSNLHKKTWMTGLQLQDFKEISSYNEKTIEVSLRMSPSHTLSPLSGNAGTVKEL